MNSTIDNTHASQSAVAGGVGLLPASGYHEGTTLDATLDQDLTYYGTHIHN